MDIKVGDKVYSDDFGFIEGFISEVVETPLHPLVKFRATIKAKVRFNLMGVEYINEKNISTSSFHINPLVTSNREWTDYGFFGKMFFFTSPDGISQFKIDYNSHMYNYHIEKAKYFNTALL
jgi:hypothetical protein